MWGKFCHNDKIYASVSIFKFTRVVIFYSKDVELENHVQSSLRENLKEIGQRCIQELREFIDKLKADDK